MMTKMDLKTEPQLQVNKRTASKKTTSSFEKQTLMAVTGKEIFLNVSKF